MVINLEVNVIHAKRQMDLDELEDVGDGQYKELNSIKFMLDDNAKVAAGVIITGAAATNAGPFVTHNDTGDNLITLRNNFEKDDKNNSANKGNAEVVPSSKVAEISKERFQQKRKLRSNFKSNNNYRNDTQSISYIVCLISDYHILLYSNNFRWW